MLYCKNNIYTKKNKIRIYTIYVYSYFCFSLHNYYLYDISSNYSDYFVSLFIFITFIILDYKCVIYEIKIKKMRLYLAIVQTSFFIYESFKRVATPKCALTYLCNTFRNHYIFKQRTTPKCILTYLCNTFRNHYRFK